MKKIILFGLCVILLSSSAFGAVSDDLNTKVISYFPYDVDADDTAGVATSVVIGATKITAGCLLNDCYTFGTSNYRIVHTDTTNLKWNADDSYTLNAWTYIDSSQSIATHFMFTSTNNPGYSWETVKSSYDSTGNTWVSYIEGDNGGLAYATGSVSIEDGWHMFTQAWNGTTRTISFYFDNTLIDSDNTPLTGVNPLINDGNWYIGNRNSPYNLGFNGEVDEVSFFVGELSLEERTFLYNSGSPTSDQQYPFGTVSNLSINLIYPVNETHYNFNNQNITKNYNGTIITTTNTASNCSVVSTLENGSQITLWNNLTDSSTNQQFVNFTSIPEDNITVSVFCNDGTDNTSTTFWFVIDRTPITVITNIINNTEYKTPFNLFVSYFDKYLFRTNTTLIYDKTNVTYYNNFSGDLSGKDLFYNVTKFINTTNQTFPIGDYSLIFQASDTHTDNKYFEKEKINVKKEPKNIFNGKKLKKHYEYSYSFKKHKVKFFLPEEIELTHKKKSDRLTFDYKAAKHRGETYKIIEAEKEIIYLKDSPFNYHFVLDGKLWYDNEGLDVTKIERLSEKSFKIYYNQNTGEEHSNSLGGLNEIEQIYNIRILQGKAGQVVEGDLFSPPEYNFTYNVSTNFTVDQIYINETCLFVVNANIPSFDGTYCFNLNTLYLDDVILFPQTTPLGCNAQIKNDAVMGGTIDSGFIWLDKDKTILKSGSTLCENNVLCDLDTLQPSLIQENQSISCKLSLTENFFTFLSNESNILDTANLGVCEGTSIYPILNISFFDETNNNNITVTNGYNLFFSDGSGTFNQTGNFTGFSNNLFCTDVDPSLSIFNLNLFGTFTISKPAYTTRVITIPESEGIIVSNKPYTNLSLFLIPVSNSSTVTFTWQTTEFEPINGVMRIEKCNDDGTKSLIDSTLIGNGEATANLQLLTTPYSYSVIIGDEIFTEAQYNVCHVENTDSRRYFVDVSRVQVLPVIGLTLVSCGVEKVADNIVKMEWSTNPNDESIIEGCIVGKRSGISGLIEIYRNCTEGVTGSFTRSIPNNTFDYYVVGEVTQNDLTAPCQDQVIFQQTKPTSDLLGATGVFVIALIIMVLILRYADTPIGQLFGAGIGLLGTFIFGVSALSWEATLTLLFFIIGIGIIIRKTKSREVN